MLLASGVAQLLDDTGGGHYVMVAGPGGADIVQLCEELSYLDISGPTMKSRLMVNLAHAGQDDDCEEAVQECLALGVNKFVLDNNTERLDWLGQLVQAQGKSCTF